VTQAALDGRIVVDDLTKVFRGKIRAVDRLSFTVEPGSVTGFLGPNGAGKTTTLRMVLGLVHPTAGQATIGGLPYHRLHNPTLVVGAALESASFHPARTARNHLRILCTVAGLPMARADEVLELVGLHDAARRKVRGYSMGMRQRLSLAAALLGDPRAIVLDEPANGLDPEGIAWMRGLLRDFADRGGTVLLSSHLLHEVQATVDHLVVISQGMVVASGPLDELLASSSLLLRTTDPDALGSALRAARIDYVPGPDQTFTVDTQGGRVTSEVVARVALVQRVLLTELRQSDSGGLEQLFFSLTTAKATPSEVAA